MEKELRPGDLAMVIKKGSWFGALVRITEKNYGFCQVQCCQQSLTTFFPEAELRKLETMSCPRCLGAGILSPWQLAKPQESSKGLVQICAIHGELFLWDRQLSRKRISCEVCGEVLEDDSVVAMIRHKIETGHRLYSKV